MISSIQFEEHLRELTVWHGRAEISKDFVTQVLVRLDDSGLEDRHLTQLFEKLRGQDKWPTGNQILAAARAIVAGDPTCRKPDPYTHFECVCGARFAVLKTEDPRWMVRCTNNNPSDPDRKCTRTYTVSALPGLMRARDAERVASFAEGKAMLQRLVAAERTHEPITMAEIFS